jgi:hypothetical protein
MTTQQQASPAPVRPVVPERIVTPPSREEAMEAVADRLADEVRDSARVRSFLQSSLVPAGGE